MRIFPEELEERAYRHALVREWRGAGLVAPEDAARIAADIGAPPARAAWPLRVVLFGFAALCLGAAFALVVKDISGRRAEGVAALCVAAAALALAETLIRRLRVHRQGAEEALVAGAVLLCAVGLERLLGGGARWDHATKAFSLALAAASALAYGRYGYRLAAVGVAAALGVLAGSWDLGDHAARVLLAVLYSGLLAAVSLAPGLPRREQERLEIARFFLAFAVPLCLNVRLESFLPGSSYFSSAGRVADAFGWATLPAIFLLPAAALAWGARARSRALIWAGALGLLVAVCSIKPYLGLQRRAWDPAVLGLELVVLALALKRWLDTGPRGRRGAYSSESLGGAEPGGALSLLAGVIAGAPPAPQGPETVRGRGGSFGGGGAGGGF